MAKLKLDPVDLPDETLDIIATKPAAMPMSEFIAYLIQFGAWRYRDAFQQDRNDLVVHTMNLRLVEYQRRENDLFSNRSAAPEVVKLVRKPEEKE